MDTNNKKSKIEQIRIDLEKKFEAIEKARLKKIQSKKNNDREKLTEESIIKEGVEDSESVEIVLGDRIITEENKISYEKTIEKEEIGVGLPKETINKKIEDEDKEIEVVTSTVLNKDLSKKVEEIINKPSKKTINKGKVKERKRVVGLIPNQKEVSKGEELKKDEHEEVKEEEISKSSRIGYFIYGLAAVLLLVAGYFLLDFFKETKTFEQEKMDMLISKYKNKSYLDSIELVDANNQLLDFQNQQLIDSISNVYGLELKSGSRDIARNTKNSKNEVNSSRRKKNERKELEQRITETKGSETQDVKIKVKDAPLGINNEENVSGRKGGNEEKEGESNMDELEKEKEDANKDKKSKENLEVAKETKRKVEFTKSPIYPGCAKKRSEVEKKKCLTSKMLRYIQRKFNSDLVQNIGLKQGVNKIKVSFVIDKNGYANVLQVRTENKKLEKEVIRVIQSLPKMTPGRVNGKTSQMKYVVPIQFKVRN